jgi:hypothetical protein
MGQAISNLQGLGFGNVNRRNARSGFGKQLCHGAADALGSTSNRNHAPIMPPKAIQSRHFFLTNRYRLLRATGHEADRAK